MTPRLDFFIYQRSFKTPLLTSAITATKRSGIIFRHENDTDVAFGEIAPWRGFHGEELENAILFLTAARENTALLDNIPAELTLTKSAFQFALKFSKNPQNSDHNSPNFPPLSCAALLPRNNAFANIFEKKRGENFPTFKIKIGIGAIDEEVSFLRNFLNQLLPKEKVRLDANGGLTTLEPYFEFLHDERVEFLEQPFTPEKMAPMFFPPEFEDRLALDESVSFAKELPKNWCGFVVIKPLQLRDKNEFLQWQKITPARRIYSSIFETAIGREIALQIASNDTGARNFAHGFDTLDVFENDGFDIHSSGAKMAPLNAPLEFWENFWKTKINPLSQKEIAPENADDSDSKLCSMTTAKKFLDKQFFPKKLAEIAREIFEKTLLEIEREQAKSVVIFYTETEKYIGAMLAAIASGCAIFCGNPRWQKVELREAEKMIPHGTLVLENDTAVDRKFSAKSRKKARSGTLSIATGGTGGRVKFIPHTKDTLFVAARSQIDFFGVKEMDSFSPLLPWHISGIMPIIRTIFCGGNLQICDGSFSEMTPLPPAKISKNFTLLSLVPTQLQRLLTRENGTDFLRDFDCVLLGGAPASASLLEQARQKRIRCSPGYGMTETAAFVAAQKTEDFLRGDAISFTVLQHAKIRITNTSGIDTKARKYGRIGIFSKSIPPEFLKKNDTDLKLFLTPDEGFLHGGKLFLSGRSDRYILSGGEKIDPMRIEIFLMAVAFVQAVLVVGVPDKQWGSRVVAFLELKNAPEDWEAILIGVIRKKLSREFIPKRWIPVEKLPLDERGKFQKTAMENL